MDVKVEFWACYFFLIFLGGEGDFGGMLIFRYYYKTTFLFFLSSHTVLLWAYAPRCRRAVEIFALYRGCFISCPCPQHVGLRLIGQNISLLKVPMERIIFYIFVTEKYASNSSSYLFNLIYATIYKGLETNSDVNTFTNDKGKYLYKRLMKRHCVQQTTGTLQRYLRHKLLCTYFQPHRIWR